MDTDGVDMDGVRDLHQLPRVSPTCQEADKCPGPDRFFVSHFVQTVCMYVGPKHETLIVDWEPTPLPCKYLKKNLISPSGVWGPEVMGIAASDCKQLSM